MIRSGSLCVEDDLFAQGAVVGGDPPKLVVMDVVHFVAHHGHDGGQVVSWAEIFQQFCQMVHIGSPVLVPPSHIAWDRGQAQEEVGFVADEGDRFGVILAMIKSFFSLGFLSLTSLNEEQLWFAFKRGAFLSIDGLHELTDIYAYVIGGVDLSHGAVRHDDADETVVVGVVSLSLVLHGSHHLVVVKVTEGHDGEAKTFKDLSKAICMRCLCENF